MSDDDSSGDWNDDDSSGDWNGDDSSNDWNDESASTADGSSATPSLDTVREPDTGIDATVAPWETGRGSGGWLRALGEVVLVVFLSFVVAFMFAIGGGVALVAAGYGVTSVPVLIASLLGTQVGLVLGGLSYLKWRGEPLSSIGIAFPSWKGVALVFGGTFGTLVLALTASILVQTLGLPAAQNSTGQAAAQVPSSLLLLIPIAIFVIGPCEELLFRGVVQRRLRETVSAPVAIVVASALFAVAHVVALVGNLAAMAVTISILFFPAMVFGVLYEYTKNVVVTALVHGLYDAAIFALVYVALQYGPESVEEGQRLVAALVGVV